MKITVNGKNYWLCFKHIPTYQTKYSRKVSGNFTTQTTKTFVSYRTFCYIYDDTNFPETKGNLVAEGMATHNPNDQFVKETGRSIALQRALDNGPWLSTEVVQFLRQYKNRGKLIV